VSKVKSLEDDYDIKIFHGVEITHVPPSKMPGLVEKARDLGAEIIVVHGRQALSLSLRAQTILQLHLILIFLRIRDLLRLKMLNRKEKRHMS